MEPVYGVLAIVAGLVAIFYQSMAYRLQIEVERLQREVGNNSESGDVFVLRSALRKRQEQIEELQDEIDRLRSECVVPESVGCGGQC